MRRKIIAGNWKMHKTPHEAVQLVNALRNKTVNVTQTDMVVCPPFVALYPVHQIIQGSNIALGAQNVFWETQGAFTGEISAPMLVDTGCEFVIIGHSERRQYFHETDQTVNRRLKKALEFGLKPILCIGETLEQREAEKTFDVLKQQIEGGLAGLEASQVQSMIFAYEPVWAIGTGRNATPEQAEEAHRFIRGTLAELLGRPLAEQVRIQYGGSVKPANADSLLAQPNVDGALVGGASLDAESFVAIVKSAEKMTE
ncbi:MAG: triose-phosphate isomerase [Calditrichaeota bacterium]|nr:MAG: triose-phosphate isomerase [Calditrichota bacterium]